MHTVQAKSVARKSLTGIVVSAVSVLFLTGMAYGADSVVTAPSRLVDVKAYGATGDGVKLDGAAISRALAANPTGQISFPQGTYILDNRGNSNASGLTIDGRFHGALLFSK